MLQSSIDVAKIKLVSKKKEVSYLFFIRKC